VSSRWDLLRHPFAAGLFTALLVLFAYQRAPESPFQYDDHAAVVNALPFLDASGILHSWLGFPSGRPLTQTSLAFDRWRTGNTLPEGFHVTNLLLHLVAVALLYRLALCLLAGRPRAGLEAALAALVFGLHPLQAQSVDYVINRSTLLATVGVLAFVLLVLKAADGGGWRRLWLGLALAGWFLAMASKETAVVAPILAWIALAWTRRTAPFLSRILLGLFGLEVLLYFSWMCTLPGRWQEYLVYWGTQAWVLPQYVRLAFFPWSMSVTHHVPDMERWDPRFFSAAALWALLLGTLWMLRRRRWILWAALWALVSLLPESGIIPMEDRMMEHRCTLALAAPAVAAGIVLAGLIARGAGRPVAAVLGLMLMVTMARAAVWAEPRSLWGEACRVSPHSQKPWGNFGQVENEFGRLSRATFWTVRALDVRPGDPEALQNLACIQLSMGNPEAAGAIWSALTGYAPAQFKLGTLRQSQGRSEEAEEAYRKALEYDGKRRDPKTLNALGTVLAERGDAAGGLACFQEVLSHNPWDPTARLNKGLALEVLAAQAEARAAQALSRHRQDEAEDAVEEAIGYRAEARRSLEEALERSPDDPLAALAYAKCRHAEAEAIWASLPRAPQDPESLRALEEFVADALKQTPGHADAIQVQEALARARKGWADAEGAFQRVLLSPPLPNRVEIESRERIVGEALEHLGALATRQGDLEKGLRYLRQSLAVNPDQPRIRDFLAGYPPLPPPDAPLLGPVRQIP